MVFEPFGCNGKFREKVNKSYLFSFKIYHIFRIHPTLKLFKDGFPSYFSLVIISDRKNATQLWLQNYDFIQISKPKTTTKTTEADSRCVALSMHTAPPIDGIGVDKKVPP